MISNEKLNLLNAWKSSPFQGLSISEIMQIAKKNTKPWVFNALKELVKNGLLASERKGNLDIYSLNWGNPLLFHMLQYLEAQENLGFPCTNVISEAIKAIPEKNYCLLVFGSYAEGKQKKDSDMDICFLVENAIQEKKIKPYFNEIKLNYPVHIDEHYITFEDFVKMLLRPEENLAKQILIRHKLFLNADIYYQLVKEAHEHGFKGEIISGAGKK
ncbi:MAG: nucleotidyltransferase domain-containing protein [Nanoarchaeota archaeon]|nr:nucleotidyltransferase domain-containing protein [Nanoarchaeota archaeon]